MSPQFEFDSFGPAYKVKSVTVRIALKSPHLAGKTSQFISEISLHAELAPTAVLDTAVNELQNLATQFVDKHYTERVNYG